jgi:hypothetical protein
MNNIEQFLTDFSGQTFSSNKEAMDWLRERLISFEKEVLVREAVAQFTGFLECYKGFSIKDLCCSMGLKLEEFKVIEKEKTLEFLPDDLYNEIEDYFTH